MKQQVKDFPKDKWLITARTVFLHICSLVGGLLCSRTLVFNSFMPFGIAVSAGVSKNYSLSAALGSVLGSVVTANGTESLRYIGAVLIAVAVKWLLWGFYGFTKTPMFSGICAAVGSSATAVMMIIIDPLSLADMLRFVCETLLSMSAAYFISVTHPILSQQRTLSKLSVEELCSVMISLSVALMSVAQFTVYAISPARIFSVVIILCAARYGRETAGAISGVVLGFAMSVTSEDMYYIVGAYALSGLIAGIFSRLNSFMCAISFLLSNAVLMAGFYQQYTVLAELFEVAIASVLFISLPKSTLNAVGDLFAPAPSLARVDGLRKTMVMRLKFASNALTEVSHTVDEVATRLKDINTPKISDVFVKVENESCDKCGLRIHCFETAKTGTYTAFMEMAKTVRNKGELKAEDYPENWSNRCLDPDRVAKSLHSNFTAFLSKEAAENRISQIRSVVSDQFNGLSDMLYDMAEELAESDIYDTDTAERIDSALRTMGIQATDVCCRIDKAKRMSVEICAMQIKDKSINKLSLLNKICDVTARKFDPPCIVNSGSKTLITLSEKANFRVEVGVAQYSYKNSKLCGDSYNYFNDGKGRAVMVLSDGMGCGGRAAVDSAMASGLMGRLIKAGFGFECSLKLVNSAMLFKSSDESLATVDVTCVDLFSGQADFYKAGTPETFVLKGNRVGRATCSCYPAGILRDVEFDKTSAMLSIGDIIVMISDGVSATDTGWLEQEIKSYKKSSPQQIAEHIATLAQRRRNDGHEDDITVMVGCIEKDI
ncbi:MAG: SpoIIE family protein phosphatase [Clostridia bacterium]|nr:SpoIIE family protein phosphatase [Clostridia bacterium]